MKEKIRIGMKKIVSMLVVAGLFTASVPIKEISIVKAENELYPYTMFASSSEDGAISIHAGNICLNGNIATNGSILADGNINVNGQKSEHISEQMVDINDAINACYFGSNDVEIIPEDYILEDVNISVDEPTEVKGDVELTGNITIDSALKASEDIVLLGEVKNTNNSIIYSENGNVVIDGNNVSINGLIYVPNGNIEVTAQNLNLNNIIFISNKISLNCPNINANYSTDFGRFISENADEVDDEIKILSAFGIFDKENNSISINWYSNISDAVFTVLESEDNINYNTIAEVFNDTAYEYFIESEFKKKYFKVSCNYGKNKYVESTPIVAENVNGYYTIGLIDSDNDGIVDVAENYYKTDINKTDTDGDGLSDYEEIFGTYTDPLMPDSFTAGILDGNADCDSDGASNRYELDNNLNPLVSDSDYDEILDGDEINVYLTDPLLADTDDDGASDGWEISHGYNPLEYNEYFDVSISLTGSTVTAAVSTTIEGNQIDSLSIKEMEDYTFINPDMPGYIAPCFDFSVSGTISEAEISFTLDENIINNPDIEPVICYFNEETQRLEELETRIVGTTVYAKTTHFSKYAVVNKRSRDSYVGYVVDEKTDIVFVIDYSQSMDDNDPTGKRLELTNKFIDKLSSKDRAGVVSFIRTATVLQELTNNKTNLKKAVNSIVNDDAYQTNSGTNGSLGLYKAINMLKSSDAGNKCIVFLTDGQDTHNSYSYDSIIKTAIEARVKIYSVSLVSGDQETLQKIASDTYGSFSKASDDDALDKIYVNIESEILDKEADINNDGIPDYINKILCQGLVCYDTGVRNCFAGVKYEDVIKDLDGDYDNDGLKNGEELIFTFLPGTNMFTIKLNSSPVLEDTDGDGLLDGKAVKATRENNEKITIAPKDPHPFDPDGPTGMWKKHINDSQDKVLDSTNDMWFGYTQPDYPNTGTEGIQACIDELKWLNDNGAFDYGFDYQTASDFITVINLVQNCLEKIFSTSIPDINNSNSKMQEVYGDFNTIMTISKDHIKNPDDVDRILASLGSRLLNFKADKDYVVHSQYNQWQIPGGYNNFYDAVFNVGTNGNMEPRKYNFTVSKQYSKELFGETFSLNYNMEYIIWMWRGDYLNIGAGAEIGFYSRIYSIDGTEISIDKLPDSLRYDLDHYFVNRDYVVPMQLYLYNYYGKNNIENIYSWTPSTPQWWITGFNPEHVGKANVNTQVMIGCVDFSKFGNGNSNPMLESFSESWGYDKYTIIDNDNQIVWFLWNC